MSEHVLYAVDRGVAVITLNRPERMNAIISEMGEALDRALVQAGKDPGVRAVVITGTGRAFCAGADAGRLDEIVTRGPAGPGGTASRRPGALHPDYDTLPGAPTEYRGRYAGPAALAKPVIAAVNGYAVGVGLALAVYCDVRFAAQDAIFRAVFAQRGLVAEWGLAQALIELVGRGGANDMLLSGRKIDAAEAVQMGLVNKVLPADQLMDHAMAYARDIAETVSPRSAAVIKRQLQRAHDQTRWEALELAHNEVVLSLQSDDFKEGLAALKEKRSPDFPDFQPT